MIFVRNILIYLCLLLTAISCGRSKARDQRDDKDKSYFLTELAPYQIGNEMGKRALRPGELDGFSEAIRNLARATALITGDNLVGTAFYLGRFSGFHVVATNYHITKDADHCAGEGLVFPLLSDVAYECSRFLGSWADIDLALFAIAPKGNVEDLGRLEAAASPFDFGSVVLHGQELVTFGFGKASNPNRQMMVNEDSDCKAFSRDNDFRFMNDPDQLLPNNKKTWSFSNGCDVSPGDSGSAVADRQTGRVIGLLWSGAIPKDSRVRDETFLNSISEASSDEIWSLLTYAVPSRKIGEFLNKIKDSGELSESTRRVIRAMLTSSPSRE